MGAAQQEPGTGGYTFCRYAAAVVLSTYGFAKLNGSQFTILDSELDKPMGEVHGFWLTWYYFGYSPFFGNLIGVGQVAIALLLAFRRTALLGACLGMGVMTFIVLLGVSYAIDAGATAVAVVTDGLLAGIVWRHKDQLRAVFLPERNPVYATSPIRRRHHLGIKVTGVALLLLLPATYTWRVANYNNRAPTPIDGTWSVVSGTHRPPSVGQPLDRIYFEYNRAYMVVFRYGDEWREHHFEVDPGADPDTGAIRMWERWLAKGDELFTGTYTRERDRLTLRGTFRTYSDPTELLLRRVPR